MENKRNVRTRLDNGLRAKFKRGKKQGKNHKKLHAKGGETLPNHIDDKERLKQIIVNQNNNYKDILGNLDIAAEDLIKQNPENVTPLLQMADAITAKRCWVCNRR